MVIGRKKLNGLNYDPDRQPDLFVKRTPYRVSKELSSPSDRRMSGPPPSERFTIYTDGGCWPNPGPGAWAYIALKNGEKLYEHCGFVSLTTNNRMELQAIIEALKSVAEYEGVTVMTDSQYAQRGATKWVKKWALKGWRISDAKEVLNLDQWQQIVALMKKRFVDVEWIRGHNGNIWNEACDKLAEDCLKHKK